MGFDCCVCAAHKSGMSMSYSLEFGHPEWKMCRECDSQMENLRFYAGKEEKKTQYGKARDYFQQAMRTNGGMRLQVREFLRDTIEKYDAYKIESPEEGNAPAVPPDFVVSTGGLPGDCRIKEVLGIFSEYEVYASGRSLLFSDGYEERMQMMEACRTKALSRLVDKVQKLGAAALTGVQFQYLPLDEGYFGVLTTGTAVTLESPFPTGPDLGERKERAYSFEAEQ